ncbi:MAG: hypothetical protein ACREFQ_14695, partial [Stellaceae bacterium]
PGGVTLLAINTSRTAAQTIDLPMPVERYTLTAAAAATLEDDRVRLNGHELALTADGRLPAIRGQHAPAGRIDLAPASITFLTVADAGNDNCR